MSDTITVAQRFRGPPQSANGGYLCGLLAQRVAAPAVVRLLAPPPLEVPLAVEADGDGVRLTHGGTVLARARTGAWTVEAPPPPTPDEAAAASRGYLGFSDHAFPGCFVCGPRREPGDGLRVFPGPLAGTDRVAAPWVPGADLAGPDGAVEDAFLWAALDCTGAFALLPVAPGRAVLLGEFSVQVVGAVSPGETCVLVGWPLGGAGRKRLAGSALYGPDGALAAAARATWIEVEAAAFGGG